MNKLKFKNTLFSLGITYTYERQDIIQIALKINQNRSGKLSNVLKGQS
jgi:hypothetical protein